MLFAKNEWYMFPENSVPKVHLQHGIGDFLILQKYQVKKGTILPNHHYYVLENHRFD